jgi:hypothetical protein
MNIQLIDGNFSQNEALELLTQLIHVKIKFHESKIEKSQNEEDIKMRERRIKQLQQSFYEAKQLILTKNKTCHIESQVMVS